MAINLESKGLLQNYGQAKQLEIERLLSQYGTSLKETREMYPQLTSAIEKRRLAYTLPTQELFFSPSEAAQMGLSLQEGYMLKMTPKVDQSGYDISYITPSKWEITEDNFYISPSGVRYSEADMQAWLSEPTGEVLPDWMTYISPDLTIEGLTEEGKQAYQEYQATGGKLDVVGWARLKEQERLETEEVFGAVFPEQDINEVIQYMQENPEGFLADIREIGRTEETEALLRMLMPEIAEDEIQELFGESVPEYTQMPEYTQRQLMPFPQTPVWATTTTPLDTVAFPGAYGELPATEIVPLKDAAYVFAGSIKLLPSQIAASVLQAIQGHSGASVVNRDWADERIAEANTDLDAFVQKTMAEYPYSQFLIDVSQLSRNLGYSVTTMGAGNLVALPLWLVPEPTTATKIAAAATAGAVSGFVSFRLTTYQITQEYLELKNNEMIAQRGRELTLEEENQLKADFHSSAVKYGLWEAVPEGISNMVFSGILGGSFNSALTKIVGRKVAQQIASSLITKYGAKAFGIYGEELLTETITQKGQAAIEIEAGLREENITWVEAFREIAPQTFLLTTIMAGAGQIIVKTGGAIRGRTSVINVDKIINSLKEEIGEGNPLYEEIKQHIEEEIGKGTITEQDAKKSIDAGMSGQILQDMKVAEEIAVKPTEPAVEVTAKELWQMTRQEYINQAKTLSKKTGLGKNLIPEGKSLTEVYAGMGRFHKTAVESALEQGKPVPAEVLKDYPDLAGGITAPVTPEVTVGNWVIKGFGREITAGEQSFYQSLAEYTQKAIPELGGKFQVNIAKVGALGSKGVVKVTPFTEQQAKNYIDIAIGINKEELRQLANTYGAKRVADVQEFFHEIGHSLGLDEARANKLSIEQTRKYLETTPEVTSVPPTEIATGKPYTATVFRGYKPGMPPTDEGLFGKGTYYTTNREYAETYDGKEVMQVTLNNPFVINSQKEAEAFWDEHTRPVREKALNEGKTVKEADELAAQAARQWLESQGYDGLVARNIIASGDEIVVFERKSVGPKVPVTEAGMPEAGLQPSMLEEVPAKEVRPEARGKLVQARMDDYLRLREYNAKVTEDRIAEIKSLLEKKGRLPKDLGTKGNLRLELARLEALRELEVVESVEELDRLIRQVGEELGLRSMPYAGYGGKSRIDLVRHAEKRLFKGYTSKQLEEMLRIYQEARQRLSPEIPATSIVKAEDIPTDIPALTSTQLTSQQIEKTIDLFKEAVASPSADAQRAAAIELRKHVFAQRAKSASESAQAMIAEGMNPEEAIKAAEQMFMSGKLPDVTTDYFNDLTQEMRNVLFGKVYNYWNGKPQGFTELISTFDALTNALAGKSIPRKPGTGTKYFPEGGSAWDRLARVFIGDMELLNALDQGKSLRTIIEGVYLQTGRGSVKLDQGTVDWLKELATISEEDKLLLSKPLSELTEADIKRIAESWFWRRKGELDTQLREGVITEQEYKIELAMAKDRVFPYRPISSQVLYPAGFVPGQPRLGEQYIPPAPIEETRTEAELRLRKEAMEAEAKLAEAKLKRGEFQPVVIGPELNSLLSEQLPLLTLRERQTIIRNLKNAGLTVIDIGNLIRGNKASFDLSYWRQAMLLACGHPVLFYRSNVEAWQAIWSQESAEASWTRITRHPYYQLYLDAIAKGGTDFLRPLTLPKGTERYKGLEEFGFPGGERPIPKLAERIPWIKISSRTFVTGANSISWGVFVDRINESKRYGEKIASGEITLPEGEGFSLMDDVVAYTKELGDFVQRASLGKAAPTAPYLSAMFFAPRSKLGRLLAPRHLLSSNPRVRKEAWRDFMGFIGVNGGIVMLGYFLGLWDVERDPRNAEFMSIRIGNLRIDPWTGYRQFLVLYTRIITKTGISSVTGREYESNPWDALWGERGFIRSSLSPLASILAEFVTGKNFLGEEVDVKNLKQWIDRIAPFAIQDIYEAWMDKWQHGLIAILPAIFGEGVQTYTGDWGENWAKIGLPKYPENTGYGITEPIYDLSDFWADTASQFKGVDPATLTESKGFPEYVRSIAQALQIIETIESLPNKKLISLNADPEEGTTFQQYYRMWQDRQKIVASGDEEALKAFDADERTKNAYYGNMTQAQYALLMEYHSLPESEQATFLATHPELYTNPREDWLASHPKENALLALWLDPETHGTEADVHSLEALDEINRLAKSLGIPDSAMFDRELDEITKLKLKNTELFNLLDAYSGLDNEFKGPDGLTARGRAIQSLYTDNPDFRDDIRRIEALEVGTEKNPTPEDMVEGWVDRGKIVDEYGASSAEAKLWLIDNKEAHQWALESGLLSDTGEDWNEPILRLQVQYREQFDLYDAYGDRMSLNYISNDTQRADARRNLLFDNKGKITEFGTAYYTKKALEDKIPENLIPTYVDWFGIRKKEGVDYSAGWYEDDWYLIEHKDFYQTMLNMGIWTEQRDFTKVPTKEVYNLYKQYLDLPAKSDARKQLRIQYPILDAWLVFTKDYAYASDAAKLIKFEEFLAYLQ